MGPEGQLIGLNRREIGMRALARDGPPFALHVDQRRRAKAGAGPMNHPRTDGASVVGTDDAQPFRFEHGNGEGQGLEVIEHDALLEAEFARQRPTIDDPVGVRQPNGGAIDRPRRANEAGSRANARIQEKGAQTRLERGEIGRAARWQRLRRAARVTQQGETRVGAADIAQQDGKRISHHRRLPYLRRLSAWARHAKTIAANLIKNSVYLYCPARRVLI